MIPDPAGPTANPNPTEQAARERIYKRAGEIAASVYAGWRNRANRDAYVDVAIRQAAYDAAMAAAALAAPAAQPDDEAKLAPDEVLDDGASWVMPKGQLETFTRVTAWVEDTKPGVGLMTWLTTVPLSAEEGRSLGWRLIAAADYADAALAALRGKQQ
ncbi:MAG TPA: hypothetical protein VHX38_02975 [Pseudonocardiaceae bacterium]|jgi:hypothetical protein|nr:hypothetical protein [Pseudonocardiaceae bacterium]